jgi:RNA polymerase sigma-70 factor (ECF subfamily)
LHPEPGLNDAPREVVEHLFRTYAKGVGSYVLARVGRSDVAEGITSAVFLKVVAKIDQCRTAPAAWLWTIVRNEITRYYRDRKQLASLAEVEDVQLDSAASPQEQAAQHEIHLRLHAALKHLSEEQQQIVFMKFFQAMSNIEIAQALNLGVSNVGVLVHRSLRRLRDLMEGQALPANRGSRGVRS